MNRKATVLVAEDQRLERSALARLLRLEGYEVVAVGNGERALEHVGEPIDLVVSDLRMERMDGLELLRRWRRLCPAVPFLMVTAYGEVETAVEAMKLGAADYLIKPVHPDEFLILVRRLLEARSKEEKLRQLTERLERSAGFERIIGRSAAMENVLDRARRAARSESLVLLLGESGVGKELVAEAIHHQSPRKDGPFLAVNMAALPPDLVESELFGHVKGAFTGAIAGRPGYFEAANGGTLFIDEIGDFALSSQAKLLRVLETFTVSPVGSAESHQVDVRVVAATSRDLARLVAENKFREDLFYRLNVVTIVIPPLRERRDDIPLLIDHFLDEAAARNRRERPQLSPALYAFLQRHDWPGNVRQLANAIESMVVMASGNRLDLSDLPSFVAAGPGDGKREEPAADDVSLSRLEQSAVLAALERTGGNRTKAADLLGISVRTLQRRLKEWSENPAEKTPLPSSSDS